MASATPKMNFQTERTAWMVLFGSFVLFCLLCISSTLGLYFFVFESSVPMQAIVQVGRGTAVITNSDFVERGVRQREELTGRSASISMDSQSQATLTVQLPNEASDNHALIVSITLKNSSDIRFVQAIMPRFDWSRGVYSVTLQDFRGSMDVFVRNNTGRRFLMDVYTTRQERIQLNTTGSYALEASDDRVSVVTREGEAILYSRDGQNNRLITNGAQGLAFVTRNEPVTELTRPNLLDNANFSFMLPTNNETTAILPERWGCSNWEEELPSGNYRLDAWEGRTAVRLVRSNGANSHGETRCLQSFGLNGIDITPYTYLGLETTFLINYQSLSDCGIRGSECPIMLRIIYEDINGGKQEWIQGFYYESNLALGYPPRCETCFQDHQKINEKVWYTFETGNLFNVIPSANRPVKVLTVEFYASGHQYDLFVSDIALFAGFADIIPEVGG